MCVACRMSFTLPSCPSPLRHFCTLFMVIHMVLVWVCGMAIHTHSCAPLERLLCPFFFRYSRSLLVDSTPYSWKETWPPVEGGGHQTFSKEQRYTNHLLAEVLTHHFVTTVFTVLHHTLVRVSYIYAHTHQGSSATPAVF